MGAGDRSGLDAGRARRVASVDVYLTLLVALPAIGVWLFVRLRRRMRETAVPDPPGVRLAALFGAYGTLLFFGVSGLFGAWSALHSLIAAALVAVGTPWLVVQGGVTLLRGVPTAYHRAVAALSLAFPFVLIGCYFLVPLTWRP